MLASTQRLIKENIIVQLFIWGYGIFICASWFALQLPASQARDVSSLDTLFIAASAISTTGLATVDIETMFSPLGQAAILCMIQLGGIGHILFAAFVLLNFEERRGAFKSKISSHPLSLSRGFTFVELIKQVFAYTFLCETIGMIVLYFFFKRDGIDNPFWSALFQSVSAFCTAGFSQHYMGYFSVHITTAFLSILGAFGFFLWSDLFRRATMGGESPKVIARVVRSSVMVMILFGTVLFWLSGESLVHAFFQTVSAVTTAGFNTIEMKNALPSTLFFLMVFMLLGAAITIGAINKHTPFSIFKRAITNLFSQKKTLRIRAQKILLRRVQILFYPLNKYVVVLFAVAVVLKMAEKGPFFSLLFEAASALCTVGFNTGVTTELSLFGKGVIIFLMLTGRAGILLLSFAEAKEPISYTKLQFEDVTH